MGTFSRILGTNVPRGGTFLGRNVPKKCSFLPRTFVPLRNICSSRDLHVIDKDQITALSVHVTSTTPDPGDNWPWRRLCVVCQYLYAHGTALRKNVPILAKSNVPKNVPMELGCNAPTTISSIFFQQIGWNGQFPAYFSSTLVDLVALKKRAQIATVMYESL